MKKIILLLFILFCYTQAACAQNVAIVLTKDIPIYNAIFGKFITEIKSSNPGVRVKKFVASGGTIGEINAFAPELIFSVGTKATVLAKKMSGIPKIFTMVVNPIGESFCTKEGDPLPEMTGVLISVSPEMQFKLLKQLMPKAERVGVVYDPSKSSLSVNAGVKVGDKMGLVIGNIPVNDASKVPDKIESLKGKIDVLWGVVDDTVYNKNSMEFILLFSFRNKIPLIGFSPNQVKAGALFAMYCNYPVLGTQAAQMAGEILAGKSVSDIPLQNPSDVKYSISKRAAKLMKLKISKKILDKADKIFE
ncbi:MAG: hypothetical protein KAI43_05060 [Candidatus Aureabacteria bacterium]|nr:hypothetical protein [Candidatus Auribacterota bacterium]